MKQKKAKINCYKTQQPLGSTRVPGGRGVHLANLAVAFKVLLIVAEVLQSLRLIPLKVAKKSHRDLDGEDLSRIY